MTAATTSAGTIQRTGRRSRSDLTVIRVCAGSVAAEAALSKGSCTGSLPPGVRVVKRLPDPGGRAADDEPNGRAECARRDSYARRPVVVGDEPPGKAHPESDVRDQKGEGSAHARLPA